MLPDPPLVIAFIGLVFCLAGLVKGVIGLGLPTVAIGLLGLVMLPARAAALLIVPSLITNVWQLAGGPALRPLAVRLWPLLVATSAGTLAATWLLHGSAGPRATGWLGLALVTYGLVGLVGIAPTVAPGAERWVGGIVGGLTGIVAAGTGVFVVPAVPFLGSLGLARDDLIQALGLFFTVSTVALGVALFGTGTLDGPAALASAGATAPALAGMAVGGWLRGRVSPPTFRRIFFVGILVLGAYMTPAAFR